MKRLLRTTLNIPAIYPDIYREGLWVFSLSAYDLSATYSLYFYH